MKIFKTKTRKITALILIFIFMFNTLAYANYNPPRKELEEMIDEVAMKRAIPSVLLKAIARTESVFEQFNSNGSPKINGSSVGLMQVSNRNGGYNQEKLKYDVLYNIEAGADTLLNKWSMSSYKNVSCVGNMDPNVLENWYFALWAYNGWSQVNNPNVSYARRSTYQQTIYNIVEKEYGQKINNIDFSYLPKSGNPSRSLVVPTPAYTNSANIVLYEVGDYVKTDGIRGSYNLRDVPAGKYIHELGTGQLAKITDGPVLQNGYYWYKVTVNEKIGGWIERNWLLRTGDIEQGMYVFDDIAFHWGRKPIMELFNKGIVSAASSFNPDNMITREEFLIFMSKVLDNNEKYLPIATDSKEALKFEDITEIHPWAIEHIQHMNELGLLQCYGSKLNPTGKLTRKEAAVIIESVLGENSEFENLDINTIFSDLSQLIPEEAKAVKSAYTNGTMSGKSGKFCPNDYLTRAEAAAVMTKIISRLEKL